MTKAIFKPFGDQAGSASGGIAYVSASCRAVQFIS